MNHPQESPGSLHRTWLLDTVELISLIWTAVFVIRMGMNGVFETLVLAHCGWCSGKNLTGQPPDNLKHLVVCCSGAVTGYQSVKCLKKDNDVLLTFFDLPAQNWCHMRTTNSVEGTFVSIRLRPRKTKGNSGAKASLTMMFNLTQSASNGGEKLRSITTFRISFTESGSSMV